MIFKASVFIFLFIWAFYSLSLTKSECELVIESNKDYIFALCGSNYMPEIYSVWKVNTFLVEIYQDTTEIACLATPTAPIATLIFGHSLSIDIRQYWRDFYGTYDTCKNEQYNSKPEVEICCLFDENPYKRQRKFNNHGIPVKNIKLEVHQELPMELDCR